MNVVEDANLGNDFKDNEERISTFVFNNVEYKELKYDKERLKNGYSIEAKYYRGYSKKKQENGTLQ